jgi:hypothetical protein
LGGGQALTLASMDPMLLEVPFPSRIVWARLWALDGAIPAQPIAVSATVGVRLTNYASFDGGALLSGTGAVPALVSAPKASVDLAGWVIKLTIGDAVIAQPTAFSGAAHMLGLTIQLRPTEVPLRTDLTGEGGEMLTTEGGELITPG